MREEFDDFLGLVARDLSRQRLLVFYGCSGSGKSTAIDWLLRSHPGFAGREAVRIEGPPLRVIENAAPLVVLDEITSPRELPLVAGLLSRGSTLLVASHLRPAWYCAFPRAAVFTMDADRAKITRHLERLGLHASSHAVDEYVRRFGANYTDVGIILERHPAPTFDASLGAFLRFSHLTTR